MQAHKKKTYLQLIKGIFSDIYNPDFVRLDFKKSAIVGLLMSTLICLPGSILIAVCWLIAPKEDSIFLFMSIPWILAPLVFIGVYVNNYSKPKRNDKAMGGLLSLIPTDTSLTPVSGCEYCFIKDNFLFEPAFQSEPAFPGNGSKKRGIKLLVLDMKYDCVYEDLDAYRKLLDEIVAYSQGKPIGNYIILGYHLLRIRVEICLLTPEFMRDIVDEFTYLTQRFKLQPLSAEEYIERRKKIEVLLEEENKLADRF